jgi:hypothetical protein
MTEKHYVHVKYLDAGIKFVHASSVKPLQDLSVAMREAREIAKESDRPVSVRVESVSGTIKCTVNGDGTGIVTEIPGAV